MTRDHRFQDFRRPGRLTMSWRSAATDQGPEVAEIHALQAEVAELHTLRAEVAAAVAAVRSAGGKFPLHMCSARLPFLPASLEIPFPDSLPIVSQWSWHRPTTLWPPLILSPSRFAAVLVLWCWGGGGGDDEVFSSRTIMPHVGGIVVDLLQLTAPTLPNYAVLLLSFATVGR